MIAAILSLMAAALPPGQLPKLQYYGGRVLSRVHVVPVLWGNNVDPDTRGKIGAFYKAIVQDGGGYGFNWLDEYRTIGTTPAGTGQNVGFGTAEDPITIHPSVETGTMSDNQVVAELRRQIALGPSRGGLPAPDDENTVYMVHFPPRAVITSDFATSCVQFCALHGTVAKDPPPSSQLLKNPLLFALMPDHGPGSGCDKGCGGSPLTFDNVTNSSSHELIEVVTDPDVGLTPFFEPPVAWIDPLPSDVDTDHLEIGDICIGRNDQATFDANGTTWTVQKEWSNRFSACIGTRDDALGFVSPRVTVKVKNADAAVPVTLATTRALSGTNPNPPLTVSVPNPPAGVTVDVPPSPIAAGASAAITLHVAPGASLPTTLLVHAVGKQTTAFAEVSLTANDFTLTGPSQGFPVTAGNEQSVHIVANKAGDSDAADLVLSASGRDGVTGTFVPAQISSDAGDTTATLKVDHGTPSGATPVTITATTGLVTHSTVVLLNVDGDDFSLSVDPPTASVIRGGSASVVVKTQTPHGAAQMLTLSARFPGGIGATFDPPQVQSGQQSRLTLTTGDGASFGPAAVRIVAQGSHAAQEAQFSLGVGQPAGCSSAAGAPAWALLALLIFRRRR